jgi:hypothetical protein
MTSFNAQKKKKTAAGQGSKDAVVKWHYWNAMADFLLGVRTHADPKLVNFFEFLNFQ